MTRADVTRARAVQLLIDHQRVAAGRCICGWDHPGSLAGHQVAMLTAAGLLTDTNTPADDTDGVRARMDQIAARLTPQDWEWLQTRATQPGLLAALRALHSPWAIFDDCDCDDKTTPAHVDVDEIGLTCNRSHFVCEHCCLDDEFDTETACCVDYHTHGPDKPICATTALLDQYGVTR